MHRFPFAVLAAVVQSACVTSSPVSDENRILSYGCNDIVVVGRVQNGAYEAVQSDDDPIGHGWISATLDVRQVVSGKAIPDRLPIKYFAHTYMRADRDFMFVLTPADGGFEMATAQLMSAKPRAVRECH